MRIAVFNTFDITPAENGGEIRMLNLYGRLAKTNEVRVVSYDLRCREPVRRETRASGLHIIDTQVTQSDRWAFYQANERLGLYPHDLMCIDRYEFSPNFLRAIRDVLSWAEVVIVSHPYLATTIFPRCSPLQLKVLEAHNVEILVKAAFLADAKDRALADSFLAATRRCEAYALETADLVVTVGDSDLQAFTEIYGSDPAKFRVVANGVDAGAYDHVSAEARDAFRRAIGTADCDVGVFLGSAYGPNVDSYRIARRWLTEAGFAGTIFVVGRIIDARGEGWPAVSFTEHWVGFVDDAIKCLMVKSADFLVQLMAGGGGTNLKLFDYMATGVPIIANEFGRRGVGEDGWFIPVETVEEMRNVVASRLWRSLDAIRGAEVARTIVMRDFDWSSIAQCYQTILA